ncbi:MAG TPA: DinB family protein [Aggregatilineales bacterium]|jgi:hypothetical protein|nr:DinB family protein [Aggregatilineales bacterium]
MTYIFLDTALEREQLIAAMAAVRRDVLAALDALPAESWYTPRYHNWTPAAMLAHLNTVDGFALRLIQMSLLGIRPAFGTGLVNTVNDFTARLYRTRKIEASRRDTERNLTRLADFITHLPMDRLSKPVWHPLKRKYLTIEQALQEYCLFHWHMHLQTIHETEHGQHEHREGF